MISGKIFNMTMGAPSVSNVSKSVVTASKDNTKALFTKGAGNDTNKLLVLKGTLNESTGLIGSKHQGNEPQHHLNQPDEK